jgi:hypothetical protein
LENTIANEDEQRQKLNDVSKILATLRGRTDGASNEVKRRIFEYLVKEIRIGKAKNGATSVNIVYFFDKNLIKAGKSVQLHSSRLPVQLLWGAITLLLQRG